MVMDFFRQEIIDPVVETFSSLGITDSILFRLGFFTITILIYALFVFYSYKFFSKKNPLGFNFREYLDINHPSAPSFFGFFAYLLQYIIILPFFVIIWFAFYSLFFLILAKNLDVQTILLISAALIATIRISSFVSQNLSQDLAKMLPFTLLALALMGERFFSINLLLERLYEIPSLIYSIPVYLLFIFGVEILFRFIDAIRIFVLRDDDATNP